jgi:hypothetical protein
MYPYVLGLHNIVRWLVLLAGVWIVVLAWKGWFGKGRWTVTEDRATKAFTGMLDFQFLIGLALFLFFSPLTRAAFGDMGSAMRDAPIRYFLVEHPTIMIAAVASAHVGAVQVKRGATDAEKFQRASIWFGLALAAIVGFIPWARPMVPSL